MKIGTHRTRKRLINWQAHISEFIIIKQTSCCSSNTIRASSSSQATNLRDLSYKYSPNQNKWPKSSKGVEGYTHLHQRNWCNLNSRLCTDFRFKTTENPNLCNTFSGGGGGFGCFGWQTYIHDSQVGETRPSFYVCYVEFPQLSARLVSVSYFTEYFFNILMCHMHLSLFECMCVPRRLCTSSYIC